MNFQHNAETTLSIFTCDFEIMKANPLRLQVREFSFLNKRLNIIKLFFLGYDLIWGWLLYHLSDHYFLQAGLFAMVLVSMSNERSWRDTGDIAWGWPVILAASGYDSTHYAGADILLIKKCSIIRLDNKSWRKVESNIILHLLFKLYLVFMSSSLLDEVKVRLGESL
jgi:hypothetical protein